MRIANTIWLLITVAGIFDLLLTAIAERRRELALWRVIGAEDRVVRRSVVIESATIGLLGSILGLAVGIVTAAIWIYLNFPYLLGFQLEYHFPWWSVAWYLVLVIAMTVASDTLRPGTRPASRSSTRCDPSEPTPTRLPMLPFTSRDEDSEY